jgi:hypothetical protein
MLLDVFMCSLHTTPLAHIAGLFSVRRRLLRLHDRPTPPTMMQTVRDIGLSITICPQVVEQKLVACFARAGTRQRFETEEMWCGRKTPRSYGHAHRERQAGSLVMGRL